ncbi:MAG: hypothetical protein CL661_04270 [Bacteroidetes bacterium]|nr:hypothetical protein [Bacteroidota bacterium]|tara:strand:+ start:652 stop:1056 length:405 start_codon:yes stop_codon:yes gene_type:complete
MKKLVYILVAVIILGSISCKKSNDDSPPPTPNYTIKYSVVSTGDVEMDTIKYMDSDGIEKYLLGESNFEHTFVQPATNYHGKIYISGEIINGSCNYYLSITDEDGDIQDIKDGGKSSNLPLSFKWWAEINHKED